jgi:hypothetical protein
MVTDRPNLQFDFSLGARINRRMHYISAGLSWSTLKDGSMALHM